ncbi:hypothetical protein [Rubripirellula reticaptiva]|uniref:Uncharacterized protein n=1 Tax=Rubripirellula reticaptiva TaxID=2528013 RepID=A0A5C6EKM0_9BACT|nr:hypothetical protein [Rubripirellula reticaptiva]TWU49672.1 hypothetical protein Poly59_42940 [Rubripirellula reticaptiva]
MTTASTQFTVLARRRFFQAAALASVGAVSLVQTGCLGLASNLMHAVGMDMIPAEYEGFEGSTVAIITLTDSSQYSNDVAARDLSRRVGEVFMKKVKKCQLVREDLVEQWRDEHGMDSVDYQAIGKGVEAEKVLVIDMHDLRLRDGATLYRGRADVSLRVFDVETGNLVYSKSMDEYMYPTSTGQHTSETTETRFRKLYLSMLANEIGRSFHPYDLNERIAIDSKIASQ